jgi:sensor histidine kinase YesM
MKKIREVLKPRQTYILIFAILGGMLAYFLISTFALLVNPNYNNDVNLIIRVNVSRTVTGLVAIPILYLALHYLNVRNLVSKKVFYILFLPLCYIDAFIWIFLLGVYNLIFRSDPLSFGSDYFIKAFSFLYIVIAFSGLYFLIDHWLSLKKQKEMTMEATNLANEAQLQMLRYQINPHFLFNALNTIRSMVIEDKDMARNMITKLSEFFRYSLSQNGTTDTFENEINAIKNYIEIQKIRFEDKLIVEYDIDRNLYQLKIPFFIILPLVENAIKFGLHSGKAPLKIKVIARAGDDLEISVHNTGKLVECDKGDASTKTGIENTRKRLSLYFPGQHSFKLFEDDPWVVAQINILDYKNLLQV